MAPLEQFRVRDGNRIYILQGWEIARTSSERPGVVRWSELALYTTLSGEFYLQKIGRTTVAHTPECRFVNHRMPSWLEAKEEATVHRVACEECQPVVGDEMDPHTRLEPQRYTVLRALTLPDMVTLLTEGRERPPALVSRLIIQASLWSAGEHSPLQAPHP